MGCGQIYLGKLESAILTQVPFYLGKSRADTKKEIKILFWKNARWNAYYYWGDGPRRAATAAQSGHGNVNCKGSHLPKAPL